MAAEGWSKHAVVYDKVWSPLMEPYCRDAFILISSLLPPGGAIIDVACGTGTLAVMAASQGFNVLATDISPGMLELVKEKGRLRGDIAVPISVKFADGQSLSGVPSDSYDGALSTFGTFMFPSRDEGWKSILRVLKEDGVLAAISWDRDCIFSQLGDQLRSLLPGQSARGFSQNPTMTSSGFKEEIVACGFHQVETVTSNHDSLFPSGGAFLEALMDNPGYLGVAAIVGRDVVEKMIEDFAFTHDLIIKQPGRSFMDSRIQFSNAAHICIAKKHKTL